MASGNDIVVRITDGEESDGVARAVASGDPVIAVAETANISQNKIQLKRRAFSLTEKLEAVRKVKEGASIHAVSIESTASRKQIRNWIKDQENLLKMTNKRLKKRLKGGGRKAFYPEIDAKLFEYFHAEREKRHSVTYPMLRAFLLSSALGIPLPDGFKLSDKYLFGWSRRNGLVSRRITHRGQVDNRQRREIANIAEDHLIIVQQKTAGIEANKVINMDEVPCFFDMSRDVTLSFKGTKNVDGADTGHRKSRYTVCLAISLSGRVLSTMIIFRNLVKPPVVPNLSSRIVLAASKSGTMDSNLAKKWMDTVFAKRGNYFQTAPSLLIWDSYGSHKRDDVVAYLKQKCRSEMILLPPKTTCFTQPLDVAVNAGFKAALKNEWDEWMRSSPPEITPKGYRKRPSYKAIVDMVANAVRTISPENIKRAFECCGIAEQGAIVPEDKLNERFRTVLSWKESRGLIEASQLNDDEDDDGVGAGSGEEEIVERQPADDISDSDYSEEFE